MVRRRRQGGGLGSPPAVASAECLLLHNSMLADVRPLSIPLDGQQSRRLLSRPRLTSKGAQHSSSSPGGRSFS